MKKTTKDYKNLKTSLASNVEVIDTTKVAGMRLFNATSLKQEILGNWFAWQRVLWSNR